MNKFAEDGGQLLDIEYLLDENDRRIAAFGYWAGFAGAALALRTWLAQPGMMDPVHSYPDRNHLLAETSDLLGKTGRQPRIIIIGAKGRCGRGAVELCHSLGIETTLWDLEETAGGGPFVEILEHDILVNCVLVQSDPRPFITNELLEKQRLLTTVVDVSCDPYSRYNPLPVYADCTTFARPALRLRDRPVLDLVAIDHLPSMLPKESSEDFSEQLLLALPELPGGRPWARALELFEDKKAQACFAGSMGTELNSVPD